MLVSQNSFVVTAFPEDKGERNVQVKFPKIVEGLRLVFEGNDVFVIFIVVVAIDAGQDEANAPKIEAPVETLQSIFLTVDANKVISPFSVNSALETLHLGADAETYRELESYLKEFEYQRLIDDPSDADDLSSITVLFTSPSLVLLPGYKQALAKAGVTLQEGFDFRNYERINDFVKNATHGLIEDLVGPTTLRKDADMVIINAVHFDIAWEYPFQSTYKDIVFTMLDGSTQETPMMYQKSSNYLAKVKDMDAVVLEIPYKSYRKVLRVYLPNKYDGLPNLLQRLKTYNTSAISFKLCETEVTLPKFRIETQIRVTTALDKLGLPSLTKSTVNLSKISKKPLRVDEIFSKSVIEVNEHGTKAGSATGVFVIPLSGFIAEELVANRSFYFEIRDTSSPTVYFSGIFTTPEPPSAAATQDSFVSRLNQSPPKTATAPQSSDAERETGDVPEEESSWWLHTGQPEYLMPPKPEDNESVTPRFQQPEPVFPSGIRFPYPLKDPNTQEVIDTHLRNASNNVVTP